MARALNHPHSVPLRGTPLPLPGREENACIEAAPFLYPVDRGRGGLRSKPEWGSTLPPTSPIGRT